METYKFDIPRQEKSIIKVIGVGGGGSNAVNHMYSQGIKDVEFVVVNTDSQAIKSSAVPSKIQIGMNLTQGLGAGANPEIGRNAALENKEEIREILGHDTKMVFITAGMGGGTGTGAAPVIANIAREMDILTVGIVTAPFSFEGKKKMQHAQDGINQLRESCDTVLVILNDKLREIYGNLTINNAFAQADNVLTTAAKGIAEIITVAGYVNVDFQDVRTVMYKAGAAVMGSAETSGENRAIRASEEALASPLLDCKDINGATNILLSIISGDQAELQMDELTEITEYIQEQAGDRAEVIFGHGIDPELEDKIRVTVIATGFNAQSEKREREVTAPNSLENESKIYDLEADVQYGLFENDNSVNENHASIKKQVAEDVPADADRFIPERQFQPESHYEKRDEGEDSLFTEFEDEFDFIDDDKSSSDQIVGENGMLDYIGTRERLERQAKVRVEKLKGENNPEMNPSEFKEKFNVPAYLRKSVKLENVPHSSEQNISKYKLNEESQILGNNKFLHDNVD
ncbi:MAG: cell division protein FtsZ [Cyclobacteriaceae bacterium]|nr:cell division protein FtsZ [Cyclobacteriaceae bacterium]